jgi:FAD/FMN-containing dehydrogenase
MNITQKLREQIQGAVITPEDDAYDTLRSVIFKEGNPAVIVQPKNTDDVAAAVKYAGDNGLLLSVRSGGHSGGGFGTNDQGLVIDLSPIHDVELIDKDAGIVKVGAGAHWIDVAKKLHAYGLALSSGDTTSVGVGGLTLGGGIGWMVRKYGLTIDSLVSAEVVTASGDILKADSNNNSDLFWAIRGGGGNFGVVTYLEFKAHPVTDVYCGHLIYDRASGLAATIRGWRDTMDKAPAEVTSTFLLLPELGGNPPVAMMHFCIATDDEKVAEQALAPFESVGKVLSREFGRKPYYEVLEVAHPPVNTRVIAHATFMQNFDDTAVETMVREGIEHNLILQVRHISGAMNAIPKEATAFAHRDSQVLIVSPAFVAPNATSQEIAAATAPGEKIAAMGNGSYANLSSEVGDIRNVYPSPVYERLQGLKQRYDPDNLFNQNFNIKPEENT